jgi:hypothetical protein
MTTTRTTDESSAIGLPPLVEKRSWAPPVLLVREISEITNKNFGSKDIITNGPS